jgi:hypothetical protein
MADLQTDRRGILALAGSALLGAAASTTLAGCSDAQAVLSSMWDGTTNTAVSALRPNGAQINGFCAPAERR